MSRACIGNLNMSNGWRCNRSNWASPGVRPELSSNLQGKKLACHGYWDTGRPCTPKGDICGKTRSCCRMGRIHHSNVNNNQRPTPQMPTQQISTLCGRRWIKNMLSHKAKKTNVKSEKIKTNEQHLDYTIPPTKKRTTYVRDNSSGCKRKVTSRCWRGQQQPILKMAQEQWQWSTKLPMPTRLSPPWGGIKRAKLSIHHDNNETHRNLSNLCFCFGHQPRGCGRRGAQGIRIVMYNYRFEQAIRVREQAAKLPDAHVSWVIESNALQICIWVKTDLLKHNTLSVLQIHI